MQYINYVGNKINNKNGGKMITVFHANKFGDNTKGYTKVAEVDVDTINEAFQLTNNIKKKIKFRYKNFKKYLWNREQYKYLSPWVYSWS